jgi:hypothetical protein
MAASPDNSDHSSAAETDLWVFRDGRKPHSTRQLVEELRCVLRKLSQRPARDLELDALIRAGELESALTDGESPCASQFAALTEALARRACGNRSTPLHLQFALYRYDLPGTVVVSPPEGFSYYALQPLDFASVALRAVRHGEPVAVIGIRSIGTTLSAIAKATLEGTNGEVSRITVRPTGHPYDRQTRFDERQLAWIRKHSGATTFLVIDEGPGRSGSTFLSVGEALLEAGVDQKRIILIGSREPDATALCASAAAARWSKFKFMAVTDKHPRFQHSSYIGGGDWRRVLMPSDSEWPACWPQMERLKFLSKDRKVLYKFDGLGRVGDAVRYRAKRVAEVGFGCSSEDAGDGFSAYAVISGPPLNTQALNRDLLEHIAQYCAFRVDEFSAVGVRPDPLAEMVRFNLQRELQADFELDSELLACDVPVFVDGRMQPWEWIGSQSGEILKTDVSTHGDDHFFPGPTDITWDLAGASVEWNMNKDAVQFLLATFRSLTGIDLSSRFNHFLLAYTVFRMAYCKMAISTVTGTDEEYRLQRDYQRYRELVAKQLADLSITDRRLQAHALR